MGITKSKRAKKAKQAATTPITFSASSVVLRATGAIEQAVARMHTAAAREEAAADVCEEERAEN
jgi:hypothetical protein